jgi:hypothetical protein
MVPCTDTELPEKKINPSPPVERCGHIAIGEESKEAQNMVENDEISDDSPVTLPTGEGEGWEEKKRKRRTKGEMRKGTRNRRGAENDGGEEGRR